MGLIPAGQGLSGRTGGNAPSYLQSPEERDWETHTKEGNLFSWGREWEESARLATYHMNFVSKGFRASKGWLELSRTTEMGLTPFGEWGEG